jgi:uncharacterized membrane protein
MDDMKQSTKSTRGYWAALAKLAFCAAGAIILYGPVVMTVVSISSGVLPETVAKGDIATTIFTCFIISLTGMIGAFQSKDVFSGLPRSSHDILTQWVVYFGLFLFFVACMFGKTFLETWRRK